LKSKYDLGIGVKAVTIFFSEIPCKKVRVIILVQKVLKVKVPIIVVFDDL
jgi:hypothetical protein